MKACAIVLALLAFTAVPAAAQRPAEAAPLARNTVSIEALGHGMLYSINYERLLSPDLGVRVGLSYVGIRGATMTVHGFREEEYRPDARATLTLVPITASWLRGHTHHLELGGGAVVGYSEITLGDTGTIGYMPWGIAGLAGYRYQPPGGGLFFRAAYTPFWSGGELSPLWFGLAAGYTY